MYGRRSPPSGAPKGRVRWAAAPHANRGSPTPNAPHGSCPASATQGAGSRAFRGRVRRLARASRSSHCRLCILPCGKARAAPMIEAETMLDRILAADSLQELDSVRVSLLGKSGEVTAKLKSLGAMDPGTRAAEGPKINALSEKVTDEIANRKAAL